MYGMMIWLLEGYQMLADIFGRSSFNYTYHLTNPPLNEAFAKNAWKAS